MSSSTKHANGVEEIERPAKRVRVDAREDEDEEEDTLETSKQEPQKASDLYLDTVCHEYTTRCVAFD